MVIKMKISVEFNKYKYMFLSIISIILIIISILLENYNVLIFPIGLLIFIFVKTINYLSYNIILNDDNISIYSYLSIEENEIKHEIINLKDIDKVEIKRLLFLKDVNNKTVIKETYSDNEKPYLYIYTQNEIKKVELHKYSLLQINNIKSYFIKNNKMSEDIKKQIENEYYTLKNEFMTLSNRHICDHSKHGNGISHVIGFIIMIIFSLVIGTIEFIKYGTIELYSLLPLLIIIIVDLIIDRKKEKNKLYDYYDKLIKMKEENKELLKNSCVSIEDYFSFLNDFGFALNKIKENNIVIFEYKYEKNLIKIISKNTFYFFKIKVYINDKEITEYNKEKEFIKEYKRNNNYYYQIDLITKDLKKHLLDYLIL